jgi:hypothetical protein
MSTLSIVTAAIADVRTKFEACAADITPNVDVAGRSIYSVAGQPYWTLRLVDSDPIPRGEPIHQYNVNAQATYHGWPVTGGQNGEHEEAAQLYLVWLQAEFEARPYLQSDTYPRGSGYLEADGVKVGKSRIAITGSDTAQQLGVVVDLVIPLELSIEEAF